jgi:hypothetical protein
MVLEHQFIGNSEMHTLHLDATFRNFIQNYLLVSDYYRKMKSMTDYLSNLSCVVFNRNPVLNVLWVSNKRYNHLWAIITRSMLFSTFHKVWNELVHKEITLGLDTLVVPSQAFYSNNTLTPPLAQSRPPGNGG